MQDVLFQLCVKDLLLRNLFVIRGLLVFEPFREMSEFVLEFVNRSLQRFCKFVLLLQGVNKVLTALSAFQLAIDAEVLPQLKNLVHFVRALPSMEGRNENLLAVQLGPPPGNPQVPTAIRFTRSGQFKKSRGAMRNMQPEQ